MSITWPRGKCGNFDCVVISAHNACETFPELVQPPSPEPDPRDKALWEQWKKGYDQWGKVKCACGNGYFCRQHGIWIPGADVLEGHVVPWNEQHIDSCPSFHYEQQKEGMVKQEKAREKRKSGHAKRRTKDAARSHTKKDGKQHEDEDTSKKEKRRTKDRDVKGKGKTPTPNRHRKSSEKPSSNPEASKSGTKGYDGYAGRASRSPSAEPAPANEERAYRQHGDAADGYLLEYESSGLLDVPHTTDTHISRYGFDYALSEEDLDATRDGAYSPDSDQLEPGPSTYNEPRNLVLRDDYEEEGDDCRTEQEYYRRGGKGRAR